MGNFYEERWKIFIKKKKKIYIVVGYKKGIIYRKDNRFSILDKLIIF